VCWCVRVDGQDIDAITFPEKFRHRRISEANRNDACIPDTRGRRCQAWSQHSHVRERLACASWAGECATTDIRQCADCSVGKAPHFELPYLEIGIDEDSSRLKIAHSDHDGRVSRVGVASDSERDGKARQTGCCYASCDEGACPARVGEVGQAIEPGGTEASVRPGDPIPGGVA
jgi:hypothetical protein